MSTPDSPGKPAEDEVGVLFQVADHEGVAQHAFRVNILREELESKPVLKLVQEVLITRNRQQTQTDLGLPELLQGLRLPDAQFHRPDVGKRLTARTPTCAGETPAATVMLIAMAVAAERTWSSWSATHAATSGRALNIHRLRDRSLDDAQRRCRDAPRKGGRT